MLLLWVSLDDGAGVAGDTGPEVGAFLGHGAVDGGAYVSRKPKTEGVGAWLHHGQKPGWLRERKSLHDMPVMERNSRGRTLGGQLG